MSIIRYQPASSLSTLQNEINRLFDLNRSFSSTDSSTLSTSQWNPLIDIKEDAEKFTVLVDIPGVEPEDIKVTCENNILTIQGERHGEKQTDEGSLSRLERFSGYFYRQFTLPNNIKADAIRAKCKYGVLSLQSEKATLKYIEVASDS